MPRHVDDTVMPRRRYLQHVHRAHLRPAQGQLLPRPKVGTKQPDPKLRARVIVSVGGQPDMVREDHLTELRVRDAALHRLKGDAGDQTLELAAAQVLKVAVEARVLEHEAETPRYSFRTLGSPDSMPERRTPSSEWQAWSSIWRLSSAVGVRWVAM